VETYDIEMVAVLLSLLSEKDREFQLNYLNQKDRWGYTPLDTAIDIKNTVAANLLKENGALSFVDFANKNKESTQRRNMATSPKSKNSNSPNMTIDEENVVQDLGSTYKILYAAYNGDLSSLISFRIQDRNI